jgi:hypothetical protein
MVVHSRGEMRQDKKISPDPYIDEFCTNKGETLDGLFVSQFVTRVIAPRPQRKGDS